MKEYGDFKIGDWVELKDPKKWARNIEGIPGQIYAKHDKIDTYWYVTFNGSPWLVDESGMVHSDKHYNTETLKRELGIKNV